MTVDTQDQSHSASQSGHTADAAGTNNAIASKEGGREGGSGWTVRFPSCSCLVLIDLSGQLPTYLDNNLL